MVYNFPLILVCYLVENLSNRKTAFRNSRERERELEFLLDSKHRSLQLWQSILQQCAKITGEISCEAFILGNVLLAIYSYF